MSNFIKRYLILGDEKLAIQELNPATTDSGSEPEAAHSARRADAADLKSVARSAKDEAEAEAIRQALEQTNWNRKQAAALLQISYKALLYKIRQYGIAQTKSHKLTAGA